MRPTTRQSFFDILIVENDCWVWPKAKDKDGYGAATYKKKYWRAHRLAWFFETGLITDLVLHRCGNKACCNPSHLYEGNKWDNARDAVNDGSYKIGSQNGNAVLSEEVVKQIRERYKKGLGTFKSLALDYDVSPATIGQIIRGETWKGI